MAETVFFTPAQLIEARQQAIATNKEKIVNEFTELFNETKTAVEEIINAKLLAASTSTWEQTEATQCALNFNAYDLIFEKFTDEQREIVFAYYKHNNHLNLDAELYSKVTPLTDRVVRLHYFSCDLLIPIILKLASSGYEIKVDYDENAWGFTLMWKLI